MKNNYFFAILFAFAMFSMNAQFTDDMESYLDGFPIIGAHWTDWGCGGGPGCALMASSDQARSGVLSGLVPDDFSTDAVLDLGTQTTGEWGLEFWMYIPTGQEGYWNLQGEVPIITAQWVVGNIHFNQDNLDPGNGFIDYGPNTTGDETFFTFPHDAWFQIVMNFDLTPGLTDATWGFYVDGNVVVPEGSPFEDEDGVDPIGLGGIDFYSASLVCKYYVDDFTYQNAPIPMGLEELDAKGFELYPNPVQDVLNMSANESITSVSIYNMLGQKVYSQAIGSVNHTIDTSNFAHGTYIVEVAIGSAVGSKKIVK